MEKCTIHRKRINFLFLLFICFTPLVCHPGVDAGETYADSLRMLISEGSENPLKVDQLILLGKHFYRIDYDSALVYSSMAANLSDRIGYPTGKADALYIQSLVSKNRSDLPQAQEKLDQFLEITAMLGDSIRLGKGYHQQGNLMIQKGNFELAISYLKKSLSVYLPLRDTLALIAIYNSIANYYKNVAEYDSASIYYLNGIQMTEIRGDDLKLAILLKNLGDNYFMAGQFEAARSYFLQALELNQQYPNREREIGTNYNCLARVAVEEVNYDQALDLYKQAEDYFEKADDIHGLINLDNNFGNLFLRKKEYDAAIQYFDKALAAYLKRGYQKEYAIVLENLAAAYEGKGNHKRALELYDSSLRVAAKLGNKDLRMTILLDIASLHEQLGQYKRANDYFHQYYDLKDSIFSLEKAKMINELMLKYEKEKDQAQIMKMEKDHFEKDIAIERRTRQRNSYLFGGAGSIVILIFLFSYYSQRTRKNRIITEQRISQLEEEKKLLAARSIVLGQEEERKRIAKELHDGLGVLLSSAKMHFTTIRSKSPESQPMIDKATKLLEQASGDVRRISHNMMPGLLTKFGLYEAVEELFEQMDEMEEIHAELKIDGEQNRLKENTEIILYRIIQEMVNNTLKHAEASNLTLEIRIRSDHLQIEYCDDGKGFEFKEKIGEKSLGLTSLQSRVKFLGGELEMESESGKAVCYRFEIPVA